MTVNRGRITLRALTAGDQRAFLAMVAASRPLHHPWVKPPGDPAAFRRLLGQSLEPDFCCLLGWDREAGGIAGVVNFSQISRGLLQSCYCGFYANAATAGRGLMSETLRLALRHAFTVLRLHRVEANVQPGNHRSLALVQREGFRHEGRSQRYLKIGGRWRDHERFAMTVEDWRSLRR